MEAQKWSKSKMVDEHSVEEMQHGCWTLMIEEASTSHAKRKTWTRQTGLLMPFISPSVLYLPFHSKKKKKSHEETMILYIKTEVNDWKIVSLQLSAFFNNLQHS